MKIRPQITVDNLGKNKTMTSPAQTKSPMKLMALDVVEGLPAHVTLAPEALRPSIQNWKEDYGRKQAQQRTLWK